MAFGFAGAAAGGQKALEDIVAERIAQQKLQEAIRERQQQFELDQARQNEATTQNAWTRSRAEKIDADNAATKAAKADQADTARRGRSNMAGVLSMGLDPETAKREIAVSSLNSGADVPKGVMEAITPARDPLKEYEQRKQIDQKYAKLSPPPKPGVHVVGGNLVDDSGKVLFTDPNKAKTGQNGEASPYSTERALRTVQSVDELMGKVNGRTAGYGSLLSNLPATDARNFKAELDTLKANVAFNELTAMREASKTGGALGQISDRESQLLMSALGALDAGQSPENLKAQLQKVKDSVERWQAAQHGGVAPMRPETSHGAAPVAPAADPRVDALLKKYGGG